MTEPPNKQLKQAMYRASQGERTEPRNHFREAVVSDPKNYKAWLWLAYTAANEREKRAALYKALLLEPNNDKVSQEFRRMLTPKLIQKEAKHGAFVCYSRADEVFAIELAEAIKARKLPVWIDALDMPDDADWHDAVNNALDSSGVMLLVLSPNMVNDKNTRRELDQFLLKGKIVIPLLHKVCDPRPLHLMHPIIDMRRSYNTALRVIFTLMGINRRSTPTA